MTGKRYRAFFRLSLPASQGSLACLFERDVLHTIPSPDRWLVFGPPGTHHHQLRKGGQLEPKRDDTERRTEVKLSWSSRVKPFLLSTPPFRWMGDSWCHPPRTRSTQPARPEHLIDQTWVSQTSRHTQTGQVEMVGCVRL